MAARKILKFSFWTIMLFVVLPISLLGYFLIETDAPVIHGKVYSQIKYNLRQKLDVYQPTTPIYDKAPVLVYLHGGFWAIGAKEAINNTRFNLAINELREAGFAIVSPEYTKAKQNRSPFPCCITDAYETLLWMQNNSEEYGFDMDRIGILGESAGAHIGLIAAYSDAKEFGIEEAIPEIDYVIDVYGPNDLQKIYQIELLDSIKTIREQLPKEYQDYLDLPKFLLGFDPESDTARTQMILETYSPYLRVSPNVPPTCFIHGELDIITPVDQSIALKVRLDSAGVQTELHILKNVNHGFIGANKEQKASIQKWVVDFVFKNTPELKVEEGNEN